MAKIKVRVISDQNLPFDKRPKPMDKGDPNDPTKPVPMTFGKLRSYEPTRKPKIVV
tara:strand:- start:230 stop:397 length:168 start_codon:yes stop_codon:yes gene_type:complete